MAWRDKTPAWCKLVWSHPHVILVPLAILGALLTAGILGVKFGIRNQYDATRATTRFDAEAAAGTFESGFQKATLPLTQVMEAVKLRPNESDVMALWNTYAPSFYSGAPAGTTNFVITRNGVLRGSYPPNTSGTSSIPLGFDLLASYSPFRPYGLLTIAARTTNVQGPVVNSLDPKRVRYLSFIRPIFIANVSETERWGAAQEPPSCTPTLCYDPATRTKLWGLIVLSANLQSLVFDSPAITNLQPDGYRWQMWKYPETQLGQTDKLVISQDNTTQPQPDDAVCVPVALLNQQWELCLWKESYVPAYLPAMYAVVVIGSVITAALVFSVLLAKVEYGVLLHSLVPKETIQRMRDEVNWSNSGYKQDDLQAMKLDTPAQHMLSIIAACLSGSLPDIPPLLAVRDALQRSADVYRPTEEAMKTQMRDAQYVDAEVHTALVALTGHGRASSRSSDRTVHPMQTDEAMPTFEFNLMDLVDDLEQAQTSQPAPSDAAIVDSSSVVVDVEEVEEAVPAPSSSSITLRTTPAPPTLERQRTGPLQATSDRASDVRHSSVPATPKHERLLGTALLQLMQAGPYYQPLVPLAKSSPQQQFRAAQGMCRPASLSGHGDTDGEKPAHRQSNAGSLVTSSVAPGDNYLIAAARPHIASPEKGLLTEVEVLLAGADDWSFNAYALDQATNGHPLSVLSYYLLHRSGLMQWAHMDSDKLVRFLQRVEAGYSTGNPYHNSRHAADVLQSVHVIITRGGLAPGYVDRSTRLATLLAAIVHDYQHKGRNNDFLVNTHDDLAVQYNDRSPMENHHLAAAFALLKRPELNCLSGLSKNAWKKLRALVIDLVLATDMKQHFAVLGQFNAMHSIDTTANGRNKGSSEASSLATFMEGPNYLQPLSDNDKLLSLQLALKCADLGHLAAPLDVHLLWVKDLEEEFFMQGDAEREAGLSISPLCDRNKEGVFKSQVGFFDFVALPLYRAFVARFKKASPMLKAVVANKQHWLSHAVIGSQSTSSGPNALATKPSVTDSRATPSKQPVNPSVTIKM